MAMNGHNPSESMKRLELAGIARPHAEAIAAEISAAKDDLASKLYTAQFEAALDRTAARLCIFTIAFTSLACAILGVVMSG
ncbi:MAG TPA: hypothetical protein VI168_14485 [Croceibacterium sp.]